MSIKSAREKAGMTQKQVASALHVNQSAVAHWETNRTQPTAAKLAILAELFNCTVDELLDRDAERR